MRKYEQMMEWLARLYVNTLNLIHYMHDKYCYEALEMALHDVQVRRFFATGIAGLSCAADSLSAIKYAKVYPVRNEEGIVTDFTIEGTKRASSPTLRSRAITPSTATTTTGRTSSPCGSSRRS